LGLRTQRPKKSRHHAHYRRLQFHCNHPLKKPLKVEPLSGKQKPRVPIELLNQSNFETKPVRAQAYLAPAKIQVAKATASPSLNAA
jgi:hypothetical protein